MTDVRAALAKQYGPLPAGGWLLAIAGGVTVAVFVRRRAGNNTAAELDGENLPGDNTDTAPGVGNLAGTGGSTSTRPTSNDEWRLAVIPLLIAAGFAPLTVDAAVSHYLYGEPLSPSEQAVIAKALQIAGPPPEPVPPPVPGTSSTPVTTPPVRTPAPMPGSAAVLIGKLGADGSNGTYHHGPTPPKRWVPPPARTRLPIFPRPTPTRTTSGTFR